MPDGPAPLIYAPAVPGEESYILGLTGPTGCGKTLSALRLARGLAGPDGKIFAIDTENKRMLRYANRFSFMRTSIEPPFLSEKYTSAAEVAQQQGGKVLIIDSMSHEHVGPGGTLERFEDELTRLAGTNYANREKFKGTAWIRPKRAHKGMLQRLIQLNMHVIICLRAEPKIAIRPDPDKPDKTIWVDLGMQPIGATDLPFDLTMLLMLSPDPPERRGFAMPMKLDEQDAYLIPRDRPLDEAVGAAIAAKARGEIRAPTDSKPAQAGLSGEAKNQAACDAIVARFKATKSRADHDTVIGDPDVQNQMRWFREKRMPLFKQINAALEESWRRVEGGKSNVDDRHSAKETTG
jgi:hypothetical protein